MQNRRMLPLKILAGLVAAALIGGVLFVANSFVGNPVSALLANRAIKEYVAQNYAFLDLEVEKPVYNFKYGSYMARAKSRTSIDTKFAIYYRYGKVQRDDYESYVLGKFNTLQRLSDEYSAVAKRIIAEELGYETNTTMVMYDKDEYANNHSSLELDMKFDRALPIQADVTIRLDLSDNSTETIARVLDDAHQAFVANGCIFYSYSLYAENNGMLVMVNGVAPADIESGELASRLEWARTNGSFGGISVHIKGENK